MPEGKGRVPRDVWLAPWANDALTRWLGIRGVGPGLLLLGLSRHGTPLSRGIGGEAIRVRLAKLAEGAGLNPLSPRDLRRGFITAVLEDPATFHWPSASPAMRA